jgi:uncharacterized membrane protein (DUF4010 family)
LAGISIWTGFALYDVPRATDHARQSDRAFGGVNPREVWTIAIVLAGVSIRGYAAVKYFGA